MRQFFLIASLFFFSQISWAQELPAFEKFDDFEKAFIQSDGNTYVINFWATWCAPCIKELPYFEQLHRENKNVRVILVSLDNKKDAETKLKAFIEKRKLTAQVVSLSDKDYNNWLGRIDKDWSGALPATYIFNGTHRLFAEQEFESYAELNDHINSFTNHKK